MNGTQCIADPDSISVHVLDCAFRIHTKLGPGLLESVYETVLARDLIRLGHCVERQKSISFDFEGLWFEDACRVDLVVDHSVVIEVKAVSALAPVHQRQLHTYVKLLNYRLGILLNFGAPYMRDGIKRVVNNL